MNFYKLYYTDKLKVCAHGTVKHETVNSFTTDFSFVFSPPCAHAETCLSETSIVHTYILTDFWFQSMQFVVLLGFESQPHPFYHLFSKKIYLRKAEYLTILDNMLFSSFLNVKMYYLRGFRMNYQYWFRHVSCFCVPGAHTAWGRSSQTIEWQ